MPARHHSAGYIGVGQYETLGHRPVFASEHQHRAVGRVGQRPGEHHLAAFMGGPCERQMLGAMLRAPFDIVAAGFVKEQEMLHRWGASGRSIRWAIVLWPIGVTRNLFGPVASERV